MKRRIAELLLVACSGLLFVACTEPAPTAPTTKAQKDAFAPGPEKWLTIMADGLHDPAGPGATQLRFFRKQSALGRGN
jgi:hypothetical protein